MGQLTEHNTTQKMITSIGREKLTDLDYDSDSKVDTCALCDIVSYDDNVQSFCLGRRAKQWTITDCFYNCMYNLLKANTVSLVQGRLFNSITYLLTYLLVLFVPTGT
jgi:hypothetical protein